MPYRYLNRMRRRIVARTVPTRLPEDGASLVEYALLLALIAVVAIGALVFLGNSASNTLNQVANSVNSTTGSTQQSGQPTSPVHSLGNAPDGPGNLASYGCGASGVLLTGTCSGSNGYSWLDGYFYYDGTQWDKIVSGDAQPASGTVGDQWAYQFQSGYLYTQGQGQSPTHAWSCGAHTDSNICTEVVFRDGSTISSAEQGDVAES